MRVRIEREVCTGAGDCARSVADVFWMAEDGLATVKEEEATSGPPPSSGEDGSAPGFTEWARVPVSLEDAVEAAAADCPGTCILIDRSEPEVPAEPVDEEPAATPPPRSSIPKRIAFRVRRLLGRA